MFKAVQNFNQEGTITNTSLNRVVTIDSNGNIVSDTVQQVTSTQTVTAPSLAAGGTQAQIDAYKQSLQQGGLVQTGDTVYRTTIPAQDLTISCISSTGESVPNAACTTYSGAIPATSLQDTSLSGLLNKVQTTEQDTPTTQYVLVDQTKTVTPEGTTDWIANGGGTQDYNVALLQREISTSQDNGGGIQSLAVPYDQLPESVQAQLPAPGAQSAPLVSATPDTTSVGTAPVDTSVQSQNIAAPIDVAGDAAANAIDAVHSSGWTFLTQQEQIQQQQQQLLDQQYAQQSDAVNVGAWTTQDQVVQAQQLAQGNAAYAQRVQEAGIAAYIQNSPTTQYIQSNLQMMGQSPAQISAYTQQLVSGGVQVASTQAQADAYLAQQSQASIASVDQQIAANQNLLPTPSSAQGSVVVAQSTGVSYPDGVVPPGATPAPTGSGIQTASLVGPSSAGEVTSAPAPGSVQTLTNGQLLSQVINGGVNAPAAASELASHAVSSVASGLDYLTSPDTYLSSLDVGTASTDGYSASLYTDSSGGTSGSGATTAAQSSTIDWGQYYSLETTQGSEYYVQPLAAQSLPQIPSAFNDIQIDSAANTLTVESSGSAFSCWLFGCAQTVSAVSNPTIAALQQQGVTSISNYNGAVVVWVQPTDGSATRTYTLPSVTPPAEGTDTGQFLTNVLNALPTQGGK